MASATCTGIRSIRAIDYVLYRYARSTYYVLERLVKSTSDPCLSRKGCLSSLYNVLPRRFHGRFSGSCCRPNGRKLRSMQSPINLLNVLVFSSSPGDRCCIRFLVTMSQASIGTYRYIPCLLYTSPSPRD